MSNFLVGKNNKPEGTNKVPSVILRKCCACGKVADRSEFIRILKDSTTGDIIVNPTNMQFGRSMYLCKNEECFKIAMKKKRFKNLSEDDIAVIKQSV